MKLKAWGRAHDVISVSNGKHHDGFCQFREFIEREREKTISLVPFFLPVTAYPDERRCV
jgi:hypothetical protein